MILQSHKNSIKWNDTLDEYGLCDVWRIHNPSLRRYTWRRRNPLIQSCLDYWFIPQDLYCTESCKIKPAIKTDHSLITLSLKPLNHTKRGPGLWKFNKTLLSDFDYINEIKKIIKSDYGIINAVDKWEFIKMKIREK